MNKAKLSLSTAKTAVLPLLPLLALAFWLGSAGFLLLSYRMATNGAPATASDWPARILQGQPCRAPCWEGIAPGVTTVVSATAILRMLPHVDPRSVTDDDWRTTDGIWGGSLEASASQEHPIVESLWVALPKGLPLGKIRETYGEPTSISARESYGVDGGPDYGLMLLYLEQGMIFDTWGAYSDAPLLNQYTTFDLLITAPPGRVFEYVPQYSPSSYRPWEGSRPFAYYCQQSGPFGQLGPSCDLPKSPLWPVLMAAFAFLLVLPLRWRAAQLGRAYRQLLLGGMGAFMLSIAGTYLNLGETVESWMILSIWPALFGGVSINRTFFDVQRGGSEAERRRGCLIAPAMWFLLVLIFLVLCTFVMRGELHLQLAVRVLGWCCAILAGFYLLPLTRPWTKGALGWAAGFLLISLCLPWLM